MSRKRKTNSRRPDPFGGARLVVLENPTEADLRRLNRYIDEQEKQAAYEAAAAEVDTRRERMETATGHGYGRHRTGSLDDCSPWAETILRLAQRYDDGHRCEHLSAHYDQPAHLCVSPGEGRWLCDTCWHDDENPDGIGAQAAWANDGNPVRCCVCSATGVRPQDDMAHRICSAANLIFYVFLCPPCRAATLTDG